MVEPFARLIQKGELLAYKHTSFWRSMDTLRDRQVLEEMVENGQMPWAPETDPYRESNLVHAVTQPARSR